MGMEFYDCIQRKSRKRHKCHLCGKDILPGREYIIFKWRDENGFHELRRHIHCDAILEVYLGRWCVDYIYDDDDVKQAIDEEVCQKICGYDVWEDCDANNFWCEKCQKHILDPTKLRAAIQSVKDNQE